MIVTRRSSAAEVRRRVAERPWIEVIDAGDPLSLRQAMRELNARGIEVVSCVGGAQTATALLQERLVTDVYLTPSPRAGGEPGTPFYQGPPLDFERVVLKEGIGPEAGVRFEHLLPEYVCRPPPHG